MKKWHEILIALLLIAVTFFATRYYRNEQVLALRAELDVQTNGIIKTTQILQKGFDSGQIQIQDLVAVGWNLQPPPRPAVIQPDSLSQQ